MKPSKNLAEIQSDIQQAVKQSTTPASLASLIREKPPLSIPDRMKIYQEAYRIRLLESLHDDFARVLEHAGQSKFETLCLEFIVKQPSTYADLGQWSQHFSDFLSDKSPELNQLASMDWLEILSSRAPEPSPISILSAHEIERGESFKLRAFPATCLTHIQGRPYLACRQGFQSEISTVSEVDFQLLSFLTAKSRSVIEVSARAEELGLSAEQIQQKFSYWIQNEIIYCERSFHV
jgi:hypothetical protein